MGDNIIKNLLPIYSLLFSIGLLASCGSTHDELAKNQQTCSIGAVRITADFAMGRLDECLVVGQDDYLIRLIPENTPINSSPWYAFKVEADEPTEIRVSMVVQGDKHRYPPKISSDLKRWSLQKYKLQGDRMVMNIDVTKAAKFIAAQEIINNQYYLDWADKLDKTGHIKHAKFGESTLARPLYKIESEGLGNEWVIILGRQHPPEITGAMALFPFVETLLEDTALAQQFREKYRILVIPNINPDGVFAGNWRHNANGFDLNRDWGKFAQAETRQIKNYLEELVSKGHKFKIAIDFHSTRRDTFYTMPLTSDIEERYLVKHWLDSLDQEMPSFSVLQKPGNNADSGVSKQYFSDVFRTPAVTYEMGDNTDRVKIRQIAHNASTLLMTTILSDVDHTTK